jgi:hypothetical protein
VTILPRKSFQRHTAANLAVVFTQGSDDTTSDKTKARRYHLMAGHGQEKNLTSLTADIYNAESWFQGVNSLLDRVVNLFDIIGVLTFNILNTALQSLGFTRAFILLLDIALVFKNVFFPQGKAEKNLSHWQRLKNIWNKGERMQRIISNTLWLAFTGTTMLLTGGLSVVVGFAFHIFANISGVTFNIIHTFANRYDIKNHVNLICQLQAHSLSLEKRASIVKKQLATLQMDEELLEKSLCDPLIQKNPAALKFLNLQLSTLHTDHVFMQEQIVNLADSISVNNNLLAAAHMRLTSIKQHRLFALATTLTVMAGVGFLLFPPAGGFMLAGAIMVLVAGSLLDGLGKKLYFALKEKTIHPAASQETAPGSTAQLTRRIEKTPVNIAPPAFISGQHTKSLWQKKPVAVTPVTFTPVRMVL